jgi:hypothetical protein
MEIALQEGIVKVRAVYPNALPAAAGVWVDDVITLPFDRVFDLLGGPADTPINLTIRRGEKSDISILRKMVRVPGAELQVTASSAWRRAEHGRSWTSTAVSRSPRAILASEFYVGGEWRDSILPCRGADQ